MKACTFILSMAFLFGQTLMAGQPESIRWGYESSLFFLNGNGEYSDESPGQSILGDQVTYRDYHSNGGDERRLWVFPDGTAHAIYFARTKSNDNNTNCTYYVYSKDFGESFTNPKRVESISTHFPSLAVTPNGRAVIASHTFVGNKIKVHIAVDTGAGAGDFQEFIPPDNPQDYGCPFVRAPLDSHIIFWAKSHINLEPRWNAFNPKDGTFLFDEHQI
ncbi:MAG: hypothetical protein EHM72_09645, partial [Calditrichaeota bacterium]